MKASIQKWGNSAAIRIPQSILREAEFAPNQPVELKVVEGEIVIRRSSETGFDLTELLEQISDQNLHGEVDTGSPMGRESL